MNKDLETSDLLLGYKVHIPKLPKKDKCQDKKQVELITNIPEKHSLYQLHQSTQMESLQLLTSVKPIGENEGKFQGALRDALEKNSHLQGSLTQFSKEAK